MPLATPRTHGAVGHPCERGNDRGLGVEARCARDARAARVPGLASGGAMACTAWQGRAEGVAGSDRRAEAPTQGAVQQLHGDPVAGSADLAEPNLQNATRGRGSGGRSQVSYFLAAPTRSTTPMIVHHPARANPLRRPRHCHRPNRAPATGYPARLATSHHSQIFHLRQASVVFFLFLIRTFLDRTIGYSRLSGGRDHAPPTGRRSGPLLP